MKTTIGKQLREGILTRNPVFVQLLGLTPALAITTSVVNSIGMGVAVTAVLICSCLFISLIRGLVPRQIQVISYLAVIAVFTTAVELLTEAFFPDISISLGLFIPLMAVNCVILTHTQDFVLKNTLLSSLIRSIGTGIGFTLALVCIGFVRELIGTGRILAAADGTGGFSVFGNAYPGASFFLMPAGAFITLGFIIATVQKLRASFGKKCSDEAAATTDESECTSDNSEEAHENE